MAIARASSIINLLNLVSVGVKQPQTALRFLCSVYFLYFLFISYTMAFGFSLDNKKSFYWVLWTLTPLHQCYWFLLNNSFLFSPFLLGVSHKTVIFFSPSQFFSYYVYYYLSVLFLVFLCFIISLFPYFRTCYIFSASFSLLLSL